MTDKRSSNGSSRHAENLQLRFSELYLRLHFGTSRFISAGLPTGGVGTAFKLDSYIEPFVLQALFVPLGFPVFTGVLYNGATVFIPLVGVFRSLFKVSS